MRLQIRQEELEKLNQQFKDLDEEGHYYHEHISSVGVFAPSFPLSEELVQKYKTIYEEWKYMR